MNKKQTPKKMQEKIFDEKDIFWIPEEVIKWISLVNCDLQVFPSLSFVEDKSLPKDCAVFGLGWTQAITFKFRDADHIDWEEIKWMYAHEARHIWQMQHSSDMAKLFIKRNDTMYAILQKHYGMTSVEKITEKVSLEDPDLHDILPMEVDADMYDLIAREKFEPEKKKRNVRKTKRKK